MLPGLLLAAEPVKDIFYINEAEKLPLPVNNTTNLKKDMGQNDSSGVVEVGPPITRLASFYNIGDSLQRLLDQGIETSGCSQAQG